MKTTKIKTLIFFCSSLITFEASSGTLDCPKEIKTNQSLQGKMDNWDAFNFNAPHKFSRVTFYSKHPKENASLVPDSTNKNQASWNFNEPEIWMACEYSNTNVQVIQKLPKHIKKCTAIYDAGFSSVSSVQCN